MKNKIITILFVSVLAYIMLNIKETISYTPGAPAGSTGSPFDGQNCTSCHTDFAEIPQTGWITSTIPDSGYTPGITYSITAKIKKTGTTKFGFELSPQNTSGTLLGTLVANATTQLVGTGQYITHVSSSTAGTDSTSWTFDWTAPPAGTGNVTFYAAFNASNGDNAAAGDQIYTSILTVKDTTPVGIEEHLVGQKSQFMVFPNPSNGKFIVSEHATGEKSMLNTIDIYNILGELVYSSSASYISSLPIDITGNGSGKYFLHLNSGDGMTKIPVAIIK